MKDDCTTNSHHITYTFLFKRLGECTFWTCEWKGYAVNWTGITPKQSKNSQADKIAPHFEEARQESPEYWRVLTSLRVRLCVDSGDSTSDKIVWHRRTYYIQKYLTPTSIHQCLKGEHGKWLGPWLGWLGGETYGHTWTKHSGLITLSQIESKSNGRVGSISHKCCFTWREVGVNLPVRTSSKLLTCTLVHLEYLSYVPVAQSRPLTDFRR